jgi:hypothetical protein
MLSALQSSFMAGVLSKLGTGFAPEFALNLKTGVFSWREPHCIALENTPVRR